jgi:hypothetical protein
MARSARGAQHVHVGDTGDTGRAGRGNNIALTTPVSAAAPGPGAAAGDTCPTCGGAPGPGKTGRCATCVDEEWTKLRAEMGEEWYHRHRDGVM